MTQTTGQTQPTARSGAEPEHAVIGALRKTMRAGGYDALVALSQDNVTYTAGFLVPSHASNRFRRTITVIAGDAFATQIVVSVEWDQAAARSRFSDVRSYDQFSDNPADVLADALIEAGCGAGRIAIELDFMPAIDFIRLSERLPEARFEECKDLYFGARMVKTDEEVGILRRVGRLTETVMHETFKAIRPGMTELDVARRLVDGMIAGGSSNFKYRVGSGVNSSITNCGTTDNKISAGDIVRIEVLGDLENYRSNVTRTVVVGKPNARQKRLWAALILAREAAKELTVPGAAVADLYATYVRVCRAHDIEPTLRFLGHGIGQTVHEEPYITDGRDIRLAQNVTFTMEPLYMLPGEFGLHVEDMFVMTGDGFEAITGAISNNDELIEVG